MKTHYWVPQEVCGRDRGSQQPIRHNHSIIKSDTFQFVKPSTSVSRNPISALNQTASSLGALLLNDPYFWCFPELLANFIILWFHLSNAII